MDNRPDPGTGQHEVRCPRCNRLLLKVSAVTQVETTCRHCKLLVRWPTLNSEVVAPERGATGDGSTRLRVVAPKV